LFKNFKEKKMKKLMVMVAALAMISTSAYAADWNFYGSARIATFYTSVETIDAGTDDVDNYSQALQGNSRIGASVKVSDELTGAFEYGSGVNLRKLYGEWNFGAGSFLVGQTYTPLNWFYSDQVFDGDGDLLPYGGVYSGREGMLQLKFGGLKVALLPVDTAFTGAGTTETKIPAIEASYTLNLDAIALRIGGGYQTFDVKAGTLDESVDSYIVAFGAKAGLGAFYVGGNVYAGQNAGNMIVIGTNGTWNQQGLADVGTAVVDNDAFGAVLVAGFTLNDMFNFEAGYGYAETELDVAGSSSDEVSSYYLNSTITMAPGVFFVPEIGKIDGEEAGDYETDHFGIQWQINF